MFLFDGSVSPDHFATILTTVGGIVSTIGSGVVGYLLKHFLEKRKSKLEESDAEIKFTLEEFNEIHEQAAALMEDTKVDRFLILKAENGKTHPKLATAIFEQHRGKPVVVATLVYQKVRIDEMYRQMLAKAENDDFVTLETGTMADSVLKNIYISEKVTRSNMYFLVKYPLKSNPEKYIILYCTLATHSEESFDANDLSRMKVFVDFLQSLVVARLAS